MIDTDDILKFTSDVGDWLPTVRDDHKVEFLTEANEAVHNSIDQDDTNPMARFWQVWDARLDARNPNNVRILPTRPKAEDMETSDGLGFLGDEGPETVQFMRDVRTHATGAPSIPDNYWAEAFDAVHTAEENNTALPLHEFAEKHFNLGQS